MRGLFGQITRWITVCSLRTHGTGAGVLLSADNRVRETGAPSANLHHFYDPAPPLRVLVLLPQPLWQNPPFSGSLYPRASPSRPSPNEGSRPGPLKRAAHSVRTGVRTPVQNPFTFTTGSSRCTTSIRDSWFSMTVSKSLYASGASSRRLGFTSQTTP